MFRTDAEIRDAFDIDRYVVVETETYNGRRGYLAKHKTALTSPPPPNPSSPAPTPWPKEALYVEGNGFEMGYLIGKLCEPKVRRMVLKYPTAVAEELVAHDVRGLNFDIVYQTLLHILNEWCEEVYRKYEEDIPKPLRDEMHGVVAGCRAYDPDTPVTYENVLGLNAGIDCMVAFLYTGAGIEDWFEGIISRLTGLIPGLFKIPGLRAAAKAIVRSRVRAERFRTPLACNAFAAFANATSDHHFYFGRDFQFPAHNGFEDASCFMIYNPTYALDNGDPALPLVSQAAPGLVGSVTAMNAKGVALGTNVVMAANCDYKRPGLNSLLMVRYAGYCGYDLDRVVKAMENAQRGVAWIYPVGDGATDHAAIIEAGMTTDSNNWLQYPPRYVRHILGAPVFKPSRRGMFLRDANWLCPPGFLNHNKRLFAEMGYPMTDAQLGPRGYINPNWKTGLDKNYFFMPQRESRPDLVIATNLFLVPEMRLCSMDDWANTVAKSRTQDYIWRYDKLNDLCFGAYGQIDKAKAKELIDFLSPARIPDYYWDADNKEIKVIGGSVSLCDLTEKTITSHFGYQDDEWVNITLLNYV
jgi:hypothetical protein